MAIHLSNCHFYSLYRLTQSDIVICDRISLVCDVIIDCYIILSATQRPADEGDVLPPANMIAMKGNTVTLNCSSRLDNVLRWDFYAPGEKRPDSIYDGVDFNGRLWHSIDSNSCRLRTCHLTISPVRLSDAGFYVCYASSSSRRKAAAVIVLGWLFIYLLNETTNVALSENASRTRYTIKIELKPRKWVVEKKSFQLSFERREWAGWSDNGRKTVPHARGCNSECPVADGA